MSQPPKEKSCGGLLIPKENSTTVSTVMPFPYFGKKTNAAPQVWELLGDVQRYIEPFCGACGVLLNRPHDYSLRYETINDKDAYLTNLLRTIKYAPEHLGHIVNHMPVNNLDIMSANNDVKRNEETLRDKLVGGATSTASTTRQSTTHSSATP